MNIERDDNGNVIAWAWPGSYPVYYLTEDNAVLCATCVNANKDNDAFTPTASDINWEDANLYCEHCSKRIESAYAED